MPENKHFWVISLFLMLTTLAAFLEVGNHGFVNFDDNTYITENLHVQNGITLQGLIQAFTTGHAANWHPLTWISHMLDVQFFGLRAGLHHLINLLFHLANVFLLFFALRRMTKALWQSAFVAALFALHPLHVESVAWVAERKDVLSTFFWMLTLVAYSYYAEKPRLKNYLAVVAFFALGLMAKPMLVTLPFVLLLLDYWPLARFGETKPIRAIRAEPASPVSTRRKKGKIRKPTPRSTAEIEKPATRKFHWASIRPLVAEKIPLFALTALSCVVTYIAQDKGGAVAQLENFTLDIRLANALVSYLLYISKTIWPSNLAVLYPHPGLPPLWQVMAAILLLGAVTFAVIRTARKLPYLAVGWLWFTGTLIPVIGIVQVGRQAMADRYTYVPLIGLFIAAAWGIPEIFGKRRYRKEVLAASSALCLLFLFILTRGQVGYWRDSITLLDHTLNVTENNYSIYNNRGFVHSELGNPAQAIADFDSAIRINSKFAPAYSNRGNALERLGDHAGAIKDFDRALEINPVYAEAYNNRGIAFNGLGNYKRAVEDFDRAIEINPEYAMALNNRGISWMALGNRMQAFEDFSRAVRIDPHYGEALFNRGIFYQRFGKYRQAIEDYDKAIQAHYLKAGEVFCNRGAAYDGLGDHMKAIEDYDRAIKVNPENAQAYFNRGLDYGALGDHPGAVKDFDRTIAINPEHAGAYYYRGRVHTLMGNHRQGLEDLKKAAGFGYEEAVDFLKSEGTNW
jgi:protein O-mannosyl-transferase